jgi:hypothetical protein
MLDFILPKILARLGAHFVTELVDCSNNFSAPNGNAMLYASKAIIGYPFLLEAWSSVFFHNTNRHVSFSASIDMLGFQLKT